MPDFVATVTEVSLLCKYQLQPNNGQYHGAPKYRHLDKYSYECNTCEHSEVCNNKMRKQRKFLTNGKVVSEISNVSNGRSTMTEEEMFSYWWHKHYESADIQINDLIKDKEPIFMPAFAYKDDIKRAFLAGLHANAKKGRA